MRTAAKRVTFARWPPHIVRKLFMGGLGEGSRLSRGAAASADVWAPLGFRW